MSLKETEVKTIPVRIQYEQLTDSKQEALDQEYTSFQDYIHGDTSVDLYSATKQQADKNIEDPEDRDYPLILRNDCFDVEHADNEIAKYWVNLPVASVWGGINIPISTHADLENYEFGDSELVKKDGDYYVHLNAQREVAVQTEYDGVIGIDFGVRWAAVSVALPSRDTTFYGDTIRETRRHFHELNKRLQEKQAYETLDQLSGREHRIIEDCLHKISREIVDEAVDKNSFIVVGDLEGLDDQDLGSEMNRRLGQMPHYKLKQFIEYKALSEGILVTEIDEYMTSQTCNKCGCQESSREGQGRFMCSRCGLDDNADKNGATNIAKRGLGKDVQSPLSSLGAMSELALEPSNVDETSTKVSVSLLVDSEAHPFTGG